MRPLLLLLSGCVIYDKGDCPDDATRIGGRCVGDTERPCVAELVSSDPVDAETEVNPYHELRFVFSDLDPSATVEIEGVRGGTLWERSANTLVYTTDAPLEPSTDYTARVRWCHDDQEATVQFRTSALGSPVGADQVEGRVWSVDVGAARMVEPPNMGDLMLTLFERQVVLVGARAWEGDDITLMFAPAKGDGSQELCAPTQTFTASFADNPTVRFGPEDLAIPYGDAVVDFRDATASFVLAPDGSSLTAGVLEGNVDTRAFDALVDAEGAEGATCQLFASFGAACGPCVTGGNFCIDVRLVDLDGASYGVPLTPVEGECDASCQDAEGVCADASCGCASEAPEAGLAALALSALLLSRRRRAQGPMPPDTWGVPL